MSSVASALSAALLLGCGRIGYYPLGLHGEPAGFGGDAGAAQEARRDAGRDAAPRDAATREAATEAPDARSEAGSAGSDSGDGHDAGTALGCGETPLVSHWGFDTGLENWEYRPPYEESIVWDPREHGTGGAVRLETPDAPHGWLVLPAPLGDLRGRTGSAWLKLESGGPINVLSYMSNGDDYGQDLDVTLTPGEWVCFEFSFDGSHGPAFSADDIQIFGFALNADGPVTLLVDDIGVR